MEHEQQIFGLRPEQLMDLLNIGSNTKIRNDQIQQKASYLWTICGLYVCPGESPHNNEHLEWNESGRYAERTGYLGFPETRAPVRSAGEPRSLSRQRCSHCQAG